MFTAHFRKTVLQASIFLLHQRALHGFFVESIPCAIVRVGPFQRNVPLTFHRLTEKVSPPAQFSNEYRETSSSENEKERWIAVGDGDLSFSAVKSKSLDRYRVEFIATVLEDETEHHDVYKRSRENSAIVSSQHTVKFGVDATQLDSIYPSEYFDRIIFNFPHWQGKANNRYNRQLLQQFLQSAMRVLKKSGEIHVALCHGQGGSEVDTVTKWRQSWMAGFYASECGLLIKRLEPFNVSYSLSSYRGVDRPFSVGHRPLVYVFGLPDLTCIDPRFQIAYRHELRIILEPEGLERCPIQRKELEEGDTIPELLDAIVPKGIRASIPMRDVVTSRYASSDILVFLIVYSGEAIPLTRQKADKIRSAMENIIINELGLPLVKRGRMVSKPFPLLDQLIKERYEHFINLLHCLQ